jgi:hypothetical protein
LSEKISLETLNHMFQQVRQIAQTMESLKSQFAENTGCEDWQNPFRSHGLERLVLEVKKELSSFLIHRYQDHFCPNIRVSEKVNYDDWFPEDEFDAVKFIDRINDEILPNDPERMAYDTMLKEARKILPYGTGNQPQIKSGKILVGEFYPDHTKAYTGSNGYRIPPETRVSYDAASTIAAFEKFAALIICNQNIFRRVAPTQIKAPMPIGGSLWNRHDPSSPRADRKLPLTVDAWIGPISSAKLYKNGRVDFYFRKAEECRLVADALASDKPTITFPRHEINMNQLFQPVGMVPRRVVNKKLAN